VREVRVHLEQVLVAGAQPVAKSLEVSGAEPELAGAVHHRDARVASRQLVEDAAGAVRRVVVHEQDVGVGQHFEDRRGDRADVVALVVRGDDDQRLVARHFGPLSRSGSGLPGRWSIGPSAGVASLLACALSLIFAPLARSGSALPGRR
jgi:hypothetical protein